MSDIVVTIAIPTYNRAVSLKRTLECLSRQETHSEFCYEILIIDDGSTDNTHAVVKEAQQGSSVGIRYVWQEGLGYTRALNRAVREFRGQWLAFFDDDQLTHGLWLKHLLSAARQQRAKMVGGPIVLEMPEDILSIIGPVCRDIFGESPDVRDPEYYSNRHPLPSGGNRLVHRGVFDKIGDFDENMLTGGCDRDFLLRALSVGIPMGWARDAVARHVIDPGRYTPEHIKWYSLQWGCAFAYTDWKLKGSFFTPVICAARIGQALFINLPLFIWAKTTGDLGDEMDRRALLWRAVGYTRKTLQLMGPRIFSQKYFFEKVEFRRLRKIGQKA